VHRKADEGGCRVVCRLRRTPRGACLGAAKRRESSAGARQALRVSDLYDVRNRMPPLIGRAVPGIADPGHPFVLLAIDLAPADAACLDATHCLGIATEEGGPTSHTAIIARSLGITPRLLPY
jgi:phosphoenolpyruvate-protein kinase (PTS system EI component)